MKPPRRGDRRRSDDSKRDNRPDPRRPATPTMDGPRPDMPVEVIDLSAESSRDTFVDRAGRKPDSRPPQRPRSPVPRTKDKDKG